MSLTVSRRALLAALLPAVLAPAPAAGQEESAPADVTPAVPMERGNAARTGEHPGPGPIGEPSRRWRVRLGIDISASPVVADGIVYVGSASPGTLEGGALHAVEAATGIELWRRPTVPGDGIFAAAAVADGLVVAGSYDGIVIAADAATGDERWRFQAEAAFYAASPVLLDGVAYLADSYGHLYALDAADGHERWRFVAGSGYERSFGSPAVVDGVVYAVSASRRPGEIAVLSAIDAATGEERWRFTPDRGINLIGTAAVADGRVFAATRETFLYAVDAAGGVAFERYDLGATWPTEPALVDGVAYVGAGISELQAIVVETGERRWSRHLSPDVAIASAPTVADGVVYAGDVEGVVHAVDAATGEKRWQIRTVSLRSSQAISGGMLYVGGDDGALRAFGDREEGEESQIP
ncbi:MAG: PQQ-like beta-propeller repeat protein [Thermomicrobiales bacterium]|nr:PQQ-like beta-propeller repeat protein [Thermomicrobiales bacterium]